MVLVDMDHEALNGSDRKKNSVCVVGREKDAATLLGKKGGNEQLKVENEDGESKSLLGSAQRGSSKRRVATTMKSRRRVQWNDKDGDDLAQVREFQPSDASDDEYEDDEACACVIL